MMPMMAPDVLKPKEIIIISRPAAPQDAGMSRTQRLICLRLDLANSFIYNHL
jgi:hypothetical protein